MDADALVNNLRLTIVGKLGGKPILIGWKDSLIPNFHTRGKGNPTKERPLVMKLKNVGRRSSASGSLHLQQSVKKG